MAEVITEGSIETLEQYLDIDELPDPEPAPKDNAVLAQSRWKTNREEWVWEKEARSFKSKGKVFFPEPNYMQFEEMAPAKLVDLCFDKDILAFNDTRSC